MTRKITEEQRQRIIVKMNFPAPPMTAIEMEKILKSKAENVVEHTWILWLEHFLGLPRMSFTKELLERFRKVNTQKTFMNVVPAIQKLLKPLEDSCKSYCFGLYSASIALSGVAAESLQILLWEMHGVTVEGQKMTEKQEKAILGRRFERVEQTRRIEVLEAFGLITESQKTRFYDIRDIRNRYLHSWKENFMREEQEALLCYQHAFSLFKEITGVKLDDAGSVKANPLLVKWMNKQPSL